jgi:hypothetical protein
MAAVKYIGLQGFVIIVVSAFIVKDAPRLLLLLLLL